MHLQNNEYDKSTLKILFLFLCVWWRILRIITASHRVLLFWQLTLTLDGSLWETQNNNGLTRIMGKYVFILSMHVFTPRFATASWHATACKRCIPHQFRLEHKSSVIVSARGMIGLIEHHSIISMASNQLPVCPAPAMQFMMNVDGGLGLSVVRTCPSR